MAGTDTYGIVNGSPTTKQLSIRFIDGENTQYAMALDLDPAATDADIETAVQAIVATSHASVWQVNVADVYQGAKNASNAEVTAYLSVKDKVRILYQGTALQKDIRAYLPAILQGIILPGNVVDITNGPYETARDAVTTILPSGYAPVSAGFVQYSQRNDSVAADV